ncbi:hypothetical protein SGPA1_20418 [Streptomyces misionensis JCM 4497]
MPAPGVRRLGRRRGRRLGPVPERAAARHHRRHRPGRAVRAARSRRRLQPARADRRPARHGVPARRRQGVRAGQHRHGVREDRRAGPLLRHRLHGLQGAQLHAVHAARDVGCQHGRGHAVLLLHRLRRRLHRRRGGEERAARPAPRDHAVAGHRDGPVRAGRRRRGRRASLAVVQRLRGRPRPDHEGRHRAELLGHPAGLLRRHRHRQRGADRALRPDPHPVRHVPRRSDAQGLRPGAPEERRPAGEHRHRVPVLRHPGGRDPARAAGRRHQHRHAVRLRPRQRGGRGAALDPAEHAARLPGAAVAAAARAGLRLLRVDDGQPVRRDLDGVRCLAGGRARVLLRIRLPPLPPRDRCGPRGGGREVNPPKK